MVNIRTLSCTHAHKHTCTRSKRPHHARIHARTHACVCTLFQVPFVVLTIHLTEERAKRKQQKETLLKRIQKITEDRAQLGHAVDFMNREVQLQEVKHVLQIERDDLHAGGLDARPLSPAAGGTSSAPGAGACLPASSAVSVVPAVEVQGSLPDALELARKNLKAMDEERQTLVGQLQNMGVSQRSITEYGLEEDIQAADEDQPPNTGDDVQKAVEQRAGPMLLTVAESLRQRRGGGGGVGGKVPTKTKTHRKHPMRRYVPQLQPWQRDMLGGLLVLMLVALVVAVLYRGDVLIV